MLSVEVTTKCNLKCNNCFAHDSGDVFSSMDYSMAINILNEGLELGYKELSITGGEPFLWDGILNLLEYAKNVGYTYILINSNGHLFSTELCAKLAKYKDILEISITVNGSESEHDLVRGKGSYKKAIAGITNGLKYKLKINIYSVVTQRNLDYIPLFSKEMFDKFPELRAIVFIQLRGIDGDYYKVDDIKLTPEQMIAFVKMVGYLSLGGYRVYILENSLSTVVSNLLKLKWLGASPEISRDGKVVVLANGHITLNHSSYIILGNYSYGALKNTLSSNLYLDYVKKESIECTGCSFINICRDYGKLRPSESEHNIGDYSKYFCKKVLELI